MSTRPDMEAIETWIVELIRSTGLRADPFSLYGYTHGTHNSPHGIVLELSDGSSYKLAMTQLQKPVQLCTICGSPAKSRGLCTLHYERLRRARPMDCDDEDKGWQKCQQDGCRKQAVLRGYCKPHYEGRRKAGQFR